MSLVGDETGSGRTDAVRFERRVLAIVARAIAAENGERRALVVEACGDDERLRAEVDALLELDADGRLDAIHGVPAVDAIVPPDEAVDPPTGHRVGSYEIVRPIGGGGMGRVFEAIQQRPQRRVALKMLRFGLGSASSRRRFEVESEILARLRHPSIAQVYEAGVHDEDSPTGLRETPYYALEFVEGAHTIVEHVRDRGLPRTATLGLFLAVCDAVHHAHQRGVIHRDLKAGNVLVGTDGAPKVIDFGVARSTEPDRRELTGTSELVGTLSSMSPEQLAGDPDDVDLRCDVYSLGVLLYELLTGRAPYEIRGLPLHEASRRIVEAPIEPPRTHVPDLPRELETIATTALAKDRDDRYASAHELAEDIRRFLRHEPIRARPVGRWRRAVLFVRRNRVPVVTAGGIAAALIVAATTGMTLAAERRAALDEAASLEAHLLDYSEEITFGFLDQLEHEGVPTASRVALVRSAISRLEGLERNAGDDPEVLMTLAASYLKVADLLGNPFTANLGDHEGAADAYRHADELLAELLEQRPDDQELRLAQIRAVLGLGDVESQVGGLERSAASAQRALAASEALLAERPDDPETIRAHARALYSYAYSQHTDVERMLDALERAERQYRRLLELSPDDGSLTFELGTLLSGRASALTIFGMAERAFEDFDAAARQFDLALELEPGNAPYRSARVGNRKARAQALDFTGAPAEAQLAELEPAWQELVELRARDPDDVSLASSALQLAVGLVSAHLETDDLVTARRFLVAAEQLGETTAEGLPDRLRPYLTKEVERLRAELAKRDADG